MSRRASRQHSQHRIRYIKAKHVPVVLDRHGAHVATAQSAKQAQHLVKVIEAHQQPRPVGAGKNMGDNNV